MQKHFSAHAASVLLERSERTIRKALRDVLPDSHERGQARYRLAKIISAVDRNADRAARCDGVNVEVLARIDELERLFKELDDGVARLMREPDLKRRREISLREKIGSVIPRIDEKMKEICAASEEEQRAVTRIVLDEALSGCMSQFLAAIDMEPSYADLGRWEAENAARKQTSHRMNTR